MLRQSQQQRLQQKMSPQQIQFLKLLRVPTLEMEERIKEEMEINPALEYTTNEESEDPFDTDKDTEYNSEDDATLKDDTAEQVDIDDYLRSESDDNSYDYSNDTEKNTYHSVRDDVDFHEYLLEQMLMLDLDEKEKIIAQQIIGSINDDGYLSRAVAAIVNDLAFNRNVITDEETVKKIIEKVQSFDPAGIAAYTLQECLLLQLNRIQPINKQVLIAIQILSKQYDAFIKKHYSKIEKSLDITPNDFQEALAHIIKLNPKPGGTFQGSSLNNNYILPDFFLDNNEGKLEIMLNSKNAPDLRISTEFKEMLNAYDKSEKKSKKNTEAVTFIKQKLDAAQWFINSIKQRQNTLLDTMGTIAEFQKNFFLSGDETALRPMILKDVAEVTGLDISTVSRVANSKYVQTQFGTFSLKYFFSEKITMDNGDEVTNKEIKSKLTELVAAEDKKLPLKDEEIMDLLSKAGYNISRRTVAKYRDQLLIPVARLRRE